MQIKVGVIYDDNECCPKIFTHTVPDISRERFLKGEHYVEALSELKKLGFRGKQFFDTEDIKYLQLGLDLISFFNEE